MIKHWYRKFINFLAALTVLVAPAFVVAEDKGMSWNLYVDALYSRGDYGTPDTTTVWSIPVTFGFQWQRLSADITVPYVSIDGPGTIINASSSATSDGMDRMSVPAASTSEVVPLTPGRGMITDGTTTGDDGKESGLGDVNISVMYEILRGGAESPSLSAGGIIKLPTGNEENRLSTGERDYAVEVSVSQPAKVMVLFATAGYWVIGDPPGADLNNIAYATVGGGVPIGESHVVGLTLDASQAITDDGDNPVEIGTFYNYEISKEMDITIDAYKGLSDGSPDWGAGMSAGFSF